MSTASNTAGPDHQARRACVLGCDSRPLLCTKPFLDIRRLGMSTASNIAVDSSCFVWPAGPATDLCCSKVRGGEGRVGALPLSSLQCQAPVHSLW